MPSLGLSGTLGEWCANGSDRAYLLRDARAWGPRAPDRLLNAE